MLSSVALYVVMILLLLGILGSVTANLVGKKVGYDWAFGKFWKLILRPFLHIVVMMFAYLVMAMFRLARRRETQQQRTRRRRRR